MLRKKELTVFLLAVMILTLIASIQFTGCASSKPDPALEAARQKALQDSLMAIHKKKISRLFSFGLEPFKQGNYEKALKYFRQVAKLDTTGIYGKALYKRLGTAYIQTGKPDSAEIAYKMGIKKNPNDVYCYNALGYLCRVRGENEKGIETYKKLHELEPDSTSHLKYLGELYVKADMYPEAIATFQQVLQMDPNDTKSQETLSTLLSQTGDIEKVIETQKSLVEQNPENLRYRMDLAQSYFKSSQFEKAIEQFQFIVSKDPKNISALEYLGESYQQVDKFSKAVEIYKNILSFDPNNKKNRCNLAMALAATGRYASAIKEAKTVIRNNPDYGLGYIAMGVVYETCAEKCVKQKGGKITWDDKLVYKLAYDSFVKAKKDLSVKQDAENHLNYLVTVIPTKDDYFMHKNDKYPKGSCYTWIR